MRTTQRPPLLRTVTFLITVLLASFVLVAPAAAEEPADLPVLVVNPGTLANNTGDLLFHASNFGPGDTRSYDFLMRNDTNAPAVAVFEGISFGAIESQESLLSPDSDELAEYVNVTLRQDGVVLYDGGPTGMSDLEVAIAPHSQVRYRTTLSMPRGVGNEAQGHSMRVIYRWTVREGVPEIDTGIDYTVPSTDPAAPVKDIALPPTGESLLPFHVIVWAALGSLAALLLVLLAAALRRRRPEEESP